MKLTVDLGLSNRTVIRGVEDVLVAVIVENAEVSGFTLLTDDKRSTVTIVCRVPNTDSTYVIVVEGLD